MLKDKIEMLVEYASTKAPFLKKDVEKIIFESLNNLSNFNSGFKAPFSSQDNAVEAIKEAGLRISEVNLSERQESLTLNYENECLIYKQKNILKINSMFEENINPDLFENSEASIELSTHLRIINESPANCVIHAHPVFTCAISEIRGPGEKAFGIPIIDRKKMDNLFEKLIYSTKNYNIVIVYKNGIFAVDSFDFNNPLTAIFKLEKLCLNKYINRFFT